MLDHKAIKRWGQVFLKNENIKKRIANLINESENTKVLEIGPGVGAITEYIDFDKKDYWAVEIDTKLCNYLYNKYPKANILNGDFLEFELNHIKQEQQEILLFGNIPYCITTPIIIKFLKTPEFKKSYLMVQKEYFAMLHASYKTKHYSSFSVLIQSCCKIKLQFEINRLHFYPKPKIDSSLVMLEKINENLLIHIEAFAKFLRLCFFMPRKTLNNNLKKQLNIEEIKAIFIENNLAEKVRSEEISPKEFEQIFFSLSYKNIMEKIV